MNEELTAEEWKKRYEKKKTECEKLKAALSKAEAELARSIYLVIFYIKVSVFDGIYNSAAVFCLRCVCSVCSSYVPGQTI